MIVVVEGIDRVGKTTLVNKLVKAGFINLKDDFVIDNFIDDFKDYSIGKCESFVKVAEDLNSKGYNVVIDRLHLTEYVYGITKRNANINEQGVWAVDMLLSGLRAILCYVKPSDITHSNFLAGCDQTKQNYLFDFAFKMSSMDKISTNFNELDKAFSLIMNCSTKYDFYFASPFFNPEQVEREERMIKHLRGLGYKVFSPKESCHLDSKSTQLSRSVVFNSNCEAIRGAKAVFAVTDGKDIGTIWEAGYAFGRGIPVVYFAETLGENKFNLMLAQSGVDVFTNQEEVTRGALDDALNGCTRQFRGDIE